MIIDEHFHPAEGLHLDQYIAAGDVCGAHHLVRYHWLLWVLEGMPGVQSILDAGCGAGYGTSMIAEKFPSIRVQGADYDPVAIEAASLSYALPNLSYRVGDLTRWEETIGSDRYDAIVSFDSIEHIAHREIAMESLVRHLNPDGVLFLSTPCGSDHDRLSPDWHAHKIEYGTASLFAFLRRYFNNVLGSDAGEFPHKDVFHRLHQAGIDYMLRLNPVICRGPIHIPNPYWTAA
jgi:SAM-dependent methyltransferase